jgi:hypothetical protein
MAKSDTTATVEARVEEFAQDLERLLTTTKTKAEGWLGQRNQIAKHLTDISDTAARLLRQLG